MKQNKIIYSEQLQRKQHSERQTLFGLVTRSSPGTLDERLRERLAFAKSRMVFVLFLKEQQVCRDWGLYVEQPCFVNIRSYQIHDYFPSRMIAN